MQRADFGERIVADALGREPARQALEGRQQLERVDDVGLVEPDGDGTPVRQEIDEPFGRDQLDRFAKRRTRHLQPLAQGPFVQLRAGGDLAFDQHRPQPRGDLIVQRDGMDMQHVGHAILVERKHFACILTR